MTDKMGDDEPSASRASNPRKEGVSRILGIRVVVHSYHHPAEIGFVCVRYGREGICG